MWKPIHAISARQLLSRLSFFYAFVSAGCIGLLQKWLAEGMVSSPEEIAAMAENIMMYGMGALERA